MDQEKKPRPPPRLSRDPSRMVTQVAIRRLKLGWRKPKELHPQTPHLAQAFYKKDLFSFLLGDPVMKILSPTLIGELQGPTIEPAETPRHLEAPTQLLRILKDADITPGAFNASGVFDPETSVIQHSARVLYEKLEPLVESITQPETSS
ncbi:hypothetical protein PHMEG_00034091, partial [Phytophthora megakarya]